MSPAKFVRQLCDMQFENTFNPYVDRCAIHDMSGAPKERSKLLLATLEAAARTQIDSIWIGRDLGYRGGRRTGLAFTDDVHIKAHANRWAIAAKRPTNGEAIAERTAAVIWGVLSQIKSAVFLWNVFPLHPHEPFDQFTNRCHNAKEREAGEELLFNLICLLKPRRLVAIGNDAGKTALRLADEFEVLKVRHPSYGGQSDFLLQMRELYGIEERQGRLC